MMKFAFAGILALATTSLDPAAPQKPPILDVVNVDKNANYDYVVASFTDAFTAKLKENFGYQETPKESWQKAAVAGDLLSEAESRGRTFATGLGIKTRQEIAIRVRFS